MPSVMRRYAKKFHCWWGGKEGSEARFPDTPSTKRGNPVSRRCNVNREYCSW